MQVGNAVPVNLGAAVGAALVKHDAARPRKGSPESVDIERLLTIATDRLRATARNKRGRENGELLFSTAMAVEEDE